MSLRKASTSIKLAKRGCYEKTMVTLYTILPKRFSTYIRRRTKANNVNPVLDLSGVRAETKMEKAELLVEHFSSVHDYKLGGGSVLGSPCY